MGNGKGKRKELSPQDAALLIQMTYRAHLARRSQVLRCLLELAVAKAKLKEIRSLFYNISYWHCIAHDHEERQKFSEKIIVLLLTVDALEITFPLVCKNALASTNLLTTRIAAGCFILALIVVLFVAKNWFLRWLCIGFIIFIAVVWVIQEFTTFHILKYVILFIGVMNSLFSVYDIYDDLISRRVHSSDAEKFAEICHCPCNGVGWGVIWGFISFIFLCASIYLGLVILS